jgi:hypothetical protein
MTKRMTYAEQLKDPRWQKKRLEILERDKWTCIYCNDTETTLHVHHSEYSKGYAWEAGSYYLRTVCEHCHKELEDAKKKNRLINFILKTSFIGGSRIMWIGYDDNVGIYIYDQGKHVIAFTFNKYDYTLKDIANVLTDAIDIREHLRSLREKEVSDGS